MTAPHRLAAPGLLPLVAAVTAVTGVLCWLLLGQPGSMRLAYAAGPVTLGAALLACGRLGRMGAVAPPIRRFWRTIAGAALCVGIGSTGSVVLANNDPGMSPAVAAPMLLGVGLFLLAFLLLPRERRSGLEWLRLLVEGATVAVAGVLIFEYVITGLAGPHVDPGAARGAGALGAAALVALVVIGRAAISPASAVDAAALRALAITPAMAVAVAVLLIAGGESGRLWMSVLAAPIAGTAMCLGAYRQQLALDRPVPAALPRERHRFRDALPQAAVVATAGVVLWSSAHQLGDAQRALNLGVLAVAGLVVARQLIGLRAEDRMLAEAAYRARHDPLTGLVNRARFGEVLGARTGPVTVLLIDLDDFKLINDTMGYAVGDQLLCEVARRLRHHSAVASSFTDAAPFTHAAPSADAVPVGPSHPGAFGRLGARFGAGASAARPVGPAARFGAGASTALPARLGADEFAVLLDTGDPATADEAASSLLASLAVPYRVGEHQLLAQASIGVAVAGPQESAAEVLRNADIATHQAKAAGKAVSVRFEPRMREEVVNHARLGSELHNALVRGELHLLYQPVFDLTTGRMSGAEALVRWQHPVRGMVSPADFIPVAERTGLIVPLGSWVLREACTQLATWRRTHGPAAIPSVNVNVAGRQLRECGFVDEVAAVLSDTGLLPANLVIEVTESSVIEGRHVRDTLQSLHDMGVRLALDDFGTGQSSLSLVRDFPVDVLKLDKSFVDGICSGSDKGRLAVAAAVAELAGHLDLYTVAEGIESADQLTRLREMGYRLGQGYHLARPLPPAELEALMLSNAQTVTA